MLLPEHFFTNLGIDPALVTEFFIVFARFEHALKRSGYFIIPKNAGLEWRAKPDWTTFASDLNDQFMPGRTQQLQDAVDYLLDQPPRKQIIRRINGQEELGWSDARHDTNIVLDELLVYVRRVRNNLFHGGKFRREDFVEESARDSSLLQSCLDVLYECLELSARVETGKARDMRRYFFQELG